MPDWSPILERFEYEDWANRLWLANLQKKGQTQPDASVFAHLLSANAIWLERCRGNSPTSFPVIPLEEASLAALLEGWRQVFLEATDDRVVSYSRTTGEQLKLHLSQIAWHALNHGTYHRGELRGLCLARGDEDFPETDLYGFYFVKGQMP